MKKIVKDNKQLQIYNIPKRPVSLFKLQYFSEQSKPVEAVYLALFLVFLLCLSPSM